MAKKTKNKSEYKDIVITEQKITDTLEGVCPPRLAYR